MPVESKSYALGLDLGIASIGWSVGPLDDVQNVTDITALGTFCYPSPVAEVSKGRRVTNRSNTGAKRRSRHRLAHFKSRRGKLLRLLIRLGWWPEGEDGQIALRTRKLRERGGRIELAHPIALKVKGLSERIEDEDLGAILLHYQRHRGYLSTADLPALLKYQRPRRQVTEPEAPEAELTEEQKEIRGLNNQIGSTRSRLRDRTISEFQLDILERREPPSKANRAIRARLSPPSRVIKAIPDEGLQKQAKAKQAPATDFRYDRWMYVEEFDRVWRKQAESRPAMTHELRADIEALVFHQDPLESKEVGSCEILPNYRRCRTGELVFQRHRILSFLAHSKINGERLTRDQRRGALEFLLVRDRCTYRELRSALGLPEGVRFDDEPIPLESRPAGRFRGKAVVKAAGRDTLKGSAWGRVVSQALGISGSELANGGVYDSLVHDLITLGETARYTRLTEHYGVSDEAALAAMGLEAPKGYAKRCSRVLRRIEPFLYTADDLHSATAAAGYATADRRPVDVVERLVIGEEWTTGNPSVDAAVRWSCKVVNQIIERYGRPAIIRVELPRQMAMGNEQRADEWRRINDRAKKNEEYAKRLTDAERPVSRKNLIRMQLADECGWRSPYEPEHTIGSVPDLVDSYHVDHIVPQSHSAEDGFGNLVLCPQSLNEEKRSRTPFEAFGGDPGRWERIASFVRTCPTMPRRKRERILAASRPEQGMEARMLTQMGYVGTQITGLLQGLGCDCQFVNGAVTAEIRRRYGLDGLLPREAFSPRIGLKERFGGEKNRSDLRHHAIDAAAVLLIDRSMFQRLTRYFKAKEGPRRHHRSGDAPALELEEPFPGVRRRLAALLPDAPVVRPPCRSTSGALHEETMLPLGEFLSLTGRPNTMKVVGAKLLRFGADGHVSGAWQKGTIHHGKIYETLSGKRSLATVSLFEAATIDAENRKRARLGLPPKPIVDKTPPSAVERFVMSLSNGDTVEYVGTKGAGPGMYRVGTVSAPGGSREVRLFPVVAAESKLDALGTIRVRSAPELAGIRARVRMNAFGEVIYREPAAEY